MLGDPLSAYRFIPALEHLLINIRHDKNIRGIMVENNSASSKMQTENNYSCVGALRRAKTNLVKNKS